MGLLYGRAGRLTAHFGNFRPGQECLREDVMLFVNKVGQIVHDIVVANGGFPNKNVGDAFLVVWRPPEGGLAAIADMEPEDNIADKVSASAPASTSSSNARAHPPARVHTHCARA
jgi:hypothetical protein